MENKALIAYLGPEASWTHQAAREEFGDVAVYLPQKQIADVFHEVEKGQAEAGVVPAENSTGGSIDQTLDLLMESKLVIGGQVVMKIENHLLSRGAREPITRLYSHPQVFAQCRDWLRREMSGIELVEVSSTTRGAELAAMEGTAGALAGKMAAETYGLNILEREIQDRSDNATRFFVIGNQPSARTGRDLTSVMFGPPRQRTALLSAFQKLSELTIALRNIESRPSRRKAWEYFFFGELEGHFEDEPIVAAVSELKKHFAIVKVLGSYPDFP